MDLWVRNRKGLFRIDRLEYGNDTITWGYPAGSGVGIKLYPPASAPVFDEILERAGECIATGRILDLRQPVEVRQGRKT
jgi:hypothetical protein